MKHLFHNYIVHIESESGLLLSGNVYRVDVQLDNETSNNQIMINENLLFTVNRDCDQPPCWLALTSPSGEKVFRWMITTNCMQKNDTFTLHRSTSLTGHMMVDNIQIDLVIWNFPRSNN